MSDYENPYKFDGDPASAYQWREQEIGYGPEPDDDEGYDDDVSKSGPFQPTSMMTDKPLKSGDRVRTVDYMQIGDLVIDRHRKGVITSLDGRRGFERECWVAFEGSGFYMIHADKLERIDTEDE